MSDPYQQIRRLMAGLDIDQLRTVNALAVSMIRDKTAEAVTQFDVGDLVAFNPRGVQLTGVVIRINTRSVSVRTKTETWRVSPSRLERC